MTPKITNALIRVGMTENEAGVYAAVLSLGPSPVLKIARAAEIKRTTVYSVIETLKQKGLISVEMQGWKKLFRAENPKQIQSLLRERAAQLDKITPELLSLFNLHGRESIIRYHEGLAGVKSAYENLLNDVRPSSDYLITSDLEGWLDTDKNFFSQFSERRAKLSIKTRMLLQDSEVARHYKKYERNFNAKIKILPKKTALVTNSVIIPQRVVIHQMTPPVMALEIENQSVVQMHKELFEIIWNSLPE